MRSLLHDVARICMMFLFGVSAWFGTIAGVRLWRPCLEGFESSGCLKAQSGGIWVPPEVLWPEGLSFLLLALALLVLSLLGRMPVLVRLASLSGAAMYLLFAYDALSRLGDHNVVPSSQEDAAYGLAGAFVVLTAPVAMGIAGFCVLRRPPERYPATPGRLLGFIWFAMVAGHVLVEYAVFGSFYYSHDDPPGMGLLRSAMAAACAMVLLGAQVWVRRPRRPRSRSHRGDLPAEAKPLPAQRA